MSVRAITSNLKVIVTGNKPDEQSLKFGEAAFGKLNIDGKYHLFCNAGEGIIDLTLDAISILSLDDLLKNSNETNQQIVFTDDNGVIKVTISNQGIILSNKTSVTSDGIKDQGKPVLSAYEGNVISEEDAKIMRNFLNVYGKDEISNIKLSLVKETIEVDKPRDPDPDLVCNI